MFQIGDKVVYGVHGVCRIVDQEQRQIDRKTVTYLVLEPLDQAGSRYLVPTHNAAAMAKLKQMLTAQELTALLSSEEVREDWWIPEENLRKQTYRELITSGERTRLLRMVYTLHRHKTLQNQAGKRCHLCDENFMRDAEKLLVSEIAAVMDIGAEEAKTYLRNCMKNC